MLEREEWGKISLTVSFVNRLPSCDSNPCLSQVCLLQRCRAVFPALRDGTKCLSLLNPCSIIPSFPQLPLHLLIPPSNLQTPRHNETPKANVNFQNTHASTT